MTYTPPNTVLPSWAKGVTLVSGVGTTGTERCCVMSLANLLVLYPGVDAPVYLTGPRTDSWPGRDSLIRALAIAINDGEWWDSDVQRTEALLPIAPLIVSAAVGEEIQNRRLVMFADRYFRRLLPLVLQATEIPDLAACARDLEALPAIVDASTARLAEPILARALARDLARARALARDESLTLLVDLCRVS